MEERTGPVNLGRDERGPITNDAERLRLALDASRMGDWSWDAASDVVSFSVRAAEIFGIPPGPQMTWTRMRDLLHEEDRERVRLAVERAIEERGDYDVEYRVVNPPGRQRWVSAMGRAIYNGDEVVGMIGVVQDVTSRRQAQAERERLMASEEAARRRADEARQQADRILESISDAFFALDSSWRFTYLNRQAEVLLRRRREDLLGKGVWDEYPDAVGSAFYKEYNRAASERVTVKFVEHYAPLDTWFEVRAYPSPEGLAVYFNDINEQIKAEREREKLMRELREANVLLDTIFDRAPLGIGIWDKQLRYVRVNAALAEMNGLPPEAHVGKTVEELLPGLDPSVMESFRRVIETGAALTATEASGETPARPGKKRFWSVSYYPIQIEGETIGAGAICEEITAKKEAELALKRSEERFFRAFHASPIPMSITTMPEGKFIDANESLLATNGYAREEFIGRTSKELGVWVRPEDRDRMIESLRKTGTVRNLETLFRMKNGSARTFLLSAEVIELDGQPCILMASNDITERKQAEVEREKLLQRELAARAVAETASRAKDEFLATLSHELRTPLNAMLGWTRMLRGGKMDPETTARGLETIERNVRAQAQLIEDLLDVSRIITGKLRLNLQPVYLSSVVQAAVDVVRPAADARQIRLEVIADPAAGPVSADPDRMQQVVWNLLSNSVKFTPRGGRVQVRLRRMNSHVEISVSDTGQGISPQFLPYVFDRFRQADGGITRSYGGLGLGLAIVRHLVELHGGTVSAASDGEGRGATFTVRLPLMIIHESALSAREPDALAGAASRDAGRHFDAMPDLGGLRLLVVEDDQDARELITLILENCNARVRAVSSAAAALEQIQDWKPEVLVSDIEMPGEDGYSLIKKVRALDARSGGRIPAVALTAHARVEDRLRALSSGFDNHVAKPVEPAELAAVIASLARRGNGLS